MLFRGCIPFWPNTECASSLRYGNLPPLNGVPFVVGLEAAVGLGLGLGVDADGYRQVGAPLGRQLQTSSLKVIRSSTDLRKRYAPRKGSPVGQKCQKGVPRIG